MSSMSRVNVVLFSLLAFSITLYGDIEVVELGIGTGSKQGIYYPTGQLIADLVNKKAKRFKLEARITDGSVFNIRSVLAGQNAFGLAQADTHYRAVNGLGEWQGKGRKDDLRSICSFYTDVVAVLAADDVGIYSMADFKGKKVVLGPIGSGTRRNAVDILAVAGINAEQDLQEVALDSSRLAQAIQARKIDAFFYTVGHPSKLLKKAMTGKRKVHFVPLSNVDLLVKKFPFYSKIVFPVHFYPRVSSQRKPGSILTGKGVLSSGKRDITSIAIKTTLVTSAKVPEKVVYQVSRAIFSNIDKFELSHIGMRWLNHKKMLEGLAAPLHKGAIKFLRRAGLLEGEKVKPNREY